MIKQNLKIIATTVVVMLGLLFGAPLLFGYKLAFINEFTFDVDTMEKACSIMFGFLGTTATIVAIFVAIRIPSKIAHQQNKVALFEKRNEVYQTFKAVSNYITSIRGIGQDSKGGKVTKEQVYYGLWKTEFYIQEGNDSRGASNVSELFNEVFLVKHEFKKQFDILKSWQFLFSKMEYEQDICNFLDSYDKFMDSVFVYMLSGDLINETIKNLIKDYNILLEKNVFDLMENQLKLNGVG